MSDRASRGALGLLAEAFRVVVIDDIAGGMLNLKPLPRAVRWLGRAGLALVAVLVILTVSFDVRRAEVRRNWIFVSMDTPETQADSATGERFGSERATATSLALSFAGPLGLPPGALPITLAAIAVGWGMALAGARRSSSFVFYLILLVFAAHQVLIASLTSGLWTWLALALLLIALASSYWVRRGAPASRLWLEVSVFSVLTGSFYGILWFLGRGQPILSAGLAASQVVMLFLLTAFWLLLGSDTVDAAISVGRWLAGLIRHGISLRVARWLIPTVLVIKIGVTLVFAPTLLADAVVTGLLLVTVLILGLRGRWDETATVVIMALAVVSTVVAYYAALTWAGTSVVESLLFVVPPVAMFAFFVVWDILGRGAAFVDNESAQLPRPARLLLLLGWALLATACMFFFFAARDDAFEAFAERVAAEAVLVSGLPFALYLLVNKSRELAGLEPGDEQQSGDRVPGWAFAALGVLMAAALAMSMGLTTVQFAQAAVLTNRADMIAASEPAEAERLYKAALVANPGFYKGHFNLGTFYFGQDRLAEAIEEFEAAIDANEELLQAHLNLAVSLMAADRGVLAEEVLLRVLEIDPQFAYAHNNLGLLYQERGQWAQAQASLARALEYATEERPEYYLNAAAAEWELGHWQTAEELLAHAIELDPASADGYLAEGVMYNAWGTEAKLAGDSEAAAERYELARVAYEAAIERGADQLLVGTNLSQLYLDLGQLERAEDLARRTATDYPNVANSQQILGIILYEADRYDEARAAFQTAKELDAHYAYAWAGEALLDLEQGSRTAAAAGYEQALKLGLDRDYVRYNLGMSYASLERFEEAIEQFRAVIEMDAQYVDEARRQTALALMELGRDEEAAEIGDGIAGGWTAADLVALGAVYHERGETESAADYYLQAIEADPTFARAHAQYGLLLADLGLPAEALVYYQQAIELDSQAAVPHVNMGSALMTLGEVEAAERAYRRGAELDPGLPEAHIGIGEVLAYSGDTEGAVAELELALSLAPAHTMAHFRLGLLYYGDDECEAATPHFEATVSGDPESPNAYAFLGLCQAILGDIDAAIEAFEGGLNVCGEPETCALIRQAIDDLQN